MKKILFTLLFIFALAVPVSANEMNVNSNKVFTITFNQTFDSKSITDESVYVTDASGNKLKTISFATNGNKLQVKNSSNYTDGQKYYLIITEKVQSTKGQYLKTGKTLAFSVFDGDFVIESVDPDTNSYIQKLQNKIKELEEKLAKYEDANNGDPNTEFTPLSQTIDGVTMKLNKVEQDNDSLRLYVTYINNTNDEILTGDSLAKVVANNKQYTYNHDFNFPRYYKTGVPKAETFIEPGVHEDSVIFFSPVSSNTINIVLGAGWDDFRFNNVPIIKK